MSTSPSGLSADGGLLIVIDGVKALAAAFAMRDADAGTRAVRALAKSIEQRHPNAARSMLEGLDEMFTVRRLGVDGRLAATLTNPNRIESMISVGRDTTANVKRWRDGKMINRWCAAGTLNAERTGRSLDRARVG